ncbi:MAG: hypothetical protein NXH75_09310 [Halobacteriovoraceae bacterium]|nr:hypothetical protein [Halobacteriovoraceae bacterium]
MRGDWLKLLKPLGITILILVVLEIISTALIPMMGLTKYRIPFNVLIVLYMGLKLETPYTSLLILTLQYTHSFFSIEGWEMGTIAGVLICIIISYLKDLLHLSSSLITILVTQMFQFVWFAIVSVLLYIKEESFSYILEKFWRFLPESIVLSLLAPFFFGVLDAIWRGEQDRSLGESV